MILCWYSFIVIELDEGWKINNFVWYISYDIIVNVVLFNWKEYNVI